LRVEKVGLKGCKDISFLSQNDHNELLNSRCIDKTQALFFLIPNSRSTKSITGHKKHQV